MALPKNIRPEYSTTIPSTGKKIKYQPFSVKEEKVLIIAAEGEDPDEIANAVINVLSSCITSDVDVEKLALFDIEYLFLKSRSRSVGETIKLSVNDPDDKTFSTDVEINVDKIGIKRDESHTDLISLSDDVSIKFIYPDITFFADGLELGNIRSSLNTITRCVSQIIIGDEVYNRADMTDEEIAEWLEGLTSSQLEKVLKFFTTMPKLSHTLTAKNTKTGKDFSVTLEGLSDFF